MKRERVYLILQTVVCCALAALAAASAISVYREGMALRAIDPMADIYSAQVVTEKFASIAPLFFASLGLLAAGLILGMRDRGGEGAARRAGSFGRADRPSEAMRRERRGAVQAALLIAAVALIVAGILNGSARDVLYKAITVCTECVGLG